MAIEIMSKVWKNGPDGKTDTLVLLAIADHANSEGSAYPSLTSLCEKCRLSRQGLMNVIGRLEDEKWLSVKRGGGRGNPNVYQINTRKLTEKPADKGSTSLDGKAKNKGSSSSIKGQVDKDKQSTSLDGNRQEPSKEPSGESAREGEPAPFSPEPPPEEQSPTDPVDQCPLIAAFATVAGKSPHHRVKRRLVKAWASREIRDVQLFGQVLKDDLDGHDNPKMYRGGGFAVLKRKYRKAKERKREQKQRRAERLGGGVGEQALPGDGMTHSQALRYWQDELGESGTFDNHFRIEKQKGGPPKFYLKEVAR